MSFAGQERKSYSTFVFSRKNLQRVAVVIESGHYPRALAFDKQHKCIYSMNYDTTLIRFSPTGIKLKSYNIAPRGSQTRHIWPHPGAKGVMLDVSGVLYWCQFDNGVRAFKMPDGTDGPGSKSMKLWKQTQDVYVEILKGVPEPGASGLIKKMPETPNAAIPAYGGVYIIIHFKSLGKLGVFNIAKGSFDKYIPIEDPDSIYATGGDLLIIYSPNNRLFHLWDLKTLKKIDVKISKISQNISEIAMGMNCTNYALISCAEMGDSLGKREYFLLDTSSLLSIPISSQKRFRNTSARDLIHIRLDPSFSGFASWCTSHSPNGFTYGTINGRIVNLTYEHSSYGSLSPAMDGKTVYTARGAIVNLVGKTLHRFNNSQLLPIYGSNMFLELHGKKANIRDPQSLVVLNSIDLPFKYKLGSYTKTKFTNDRKVFASAPLQRMVIINNDVNKIYVFKMTVENMNQSIHPIGILPGILWKKRLNFALGSKIIVEDAPEGLKYDQKTASLIWNVPIDTEPGVIQTLISVTEPGKEEMYHKIQIIVKKKSQDSN